MWLERKEAGRPLKSESIQHGIGSKLALSRFPQPTIYSNLQTFSLCPLESALLFSDLPLDEPLLQPDVSSFSLAPPSALVPSPPLLLLVSLQVRSLSLPSPCHSPFPSTQPSFYTLLYVSFSRQLGSVPSLDDGPFPRTHLPRRTRNPSRRGRKLQGGQEMLRGSTQDREERHCFV